MSTAQETDDVRLHRPLRSNASPTVEEDVREVEREGRSYLVFPLIAAREMVLEYPEEGTREYLSRKRLAESAPMWAGEAITYIHPQNASSTADDSLAYVSNVIGQVHKPELVDDKLRVMAWVDVAKAQSIGGIASEVVEKLRAGEELSVSAGYATIDDRFVNGTFDGQEYDVKQGHIIPDHIAIFPSDEFTARCSPEDGCAAPRANAVVDPAEADDWSCCDATDISNRVNKIMDEEITDEEAAHLGYRFLGFLGIGPEADKANSSAAQSSSETEEGDGGGNEQETDLESESAEDESEVGSETDEPDTESTGDDHQSDDAEESSDPESESETEEVDSNSESESEEIESEESGSESEESVEETEESAESNTEESDEQHMPEVLSTEELAAKSAFGVQTLQDWDDEELLALEQTILEMNPELRDEMPEESQSPEEEEETNTEESQSSNEENMEETRENSEDGEFVTKDEFAELKTMVEDAINKQNSEKQEKKARAVANNLEGMTEEAVLELPEERIEALYENHGESKANFAGVPGQVDRQPRQNAEEDVDEYPAGGRTAWEQRQKEGGD